MVKPEGKITGTVQHITADIQNCFRSFLATVTSDYPRDVMYNDIHKRRGEMYFDKTKENKTGITNCNYFTFKWTSIFIP